jgi:hypothetical protein
MEVAARPIPSDPKNYERYLALARDAADLIEANNLYQHAEHCFRQMPDRAGVDK